MSTKATSLNKGTDAIALPANWTETDTTEIARFERADGAVLRIRRELPTRSADRCNRATHTDADGQLRVLYHTDSLPSPSQEIHTGGTVDDARMAALDYIRNRCTEHDRQLVTDAVGLLHCPACTGGEQ